MNKWTSSSESQTFNGSRRATAAIDAEHRREFVEKIQRRARELRERAGDVERGQAHDQRVAIKG